MNSLLITAALLLAKALSYPCVETVAPPLPSKIPFVITAFGESDLILYIGTNQGLITHDKYSHKIDFLTEKNSSLPSNHITSIICSWDGKAYIGTQNGILLWDKTSYRRIASENSNLPDNHITALAIDQDDHLWVGTHTEGLLKSIDDSNQSFKAQPIEFNNEDIFSIAFDKSGVAWVAFQKGGIACLQNGDWQIHVSTVPVENIELQFPGRFILHTALSGTYISEGSTFRKILNDSTYQNISCLYFNSKYKRLAACNENGIYVFKFNEPLKEPVFISYSSFIGNLSSFCHTKKSKQIAQAILDAFNGSKKD